MNEASCCCCAVVVGPTRDQHGYESRSLHSFYLVLLLFFRSFWLWDSLFFILFYSSLSLRFFPVSSKPNEFDFRWIGFFRYRTHFLHLLVFLLISISPSVFFGMFKSISMSATQYITCCDSLFLFPVSFTLVRWPMSISFHFFLFLKRNKTHKPP